LKSGRVQVVTVQVGVSSDTQTEIVSGLSEGDEVVVSTSTGGTSGNSAFSSSGRGMFGMGGPR
jgi:multidrug efflux pump subunit AcrA (membrane-fusion protein)